LDNEKHRQDTHFTEMGTGSLAENIPNAPELIFEICLPKAQKFWILMKKSFIGRP
jgi:hypothetical protein